MWYLIINVTSRVAMTSHLYYNFFKWSFKHFQKFTFNTFLNKRTIACGEKKCLIRRKKELPIFCALFPLRELRMWGSIQFLWLCHGAGTFLISAVKIKSFSKHLLRINQVSEIVWWPEKGLWMRDSKTEGKISHNYHWSFKYFLMNEGTNHSKNFEQ